MALYVYIKEACVGEDEETTVDVLYKIKLPSWPILGSKPPSQKVELLSPIMKIAKDKYPSSMECVQFDSKLYFLGGHMGMTPYDLEFDSNSDYDFSNPVDLTDQVYSNNVYVFDTNDESSGLKQCPSMATGKPRPWTFVANGMIYVIGGYVRRDSFKLSNESIKHFERFNPIEETWQVLDDSPLQNLCGCVLSTVFEKQHKVVIFGWEYNDFFRLVYDFRHDRWDSSLRISPFPYFICNVSDEFDGGHYYVYGLQSHIPGAPIKLGPLKDPDEVHKLCSVDISIVDTPLAWNSWRRMPSQGVDTPVDWRIRAFYRRMGFRPTNTMMYLGDGYFCHVMTGRQCSSVDPRPDCPHTYRISVIIFKELSNSSGVAVEGEVKDKTALSFQAKLLYIQDYVIKMDFHGSSDIGGFFLVGAGNCN